MSHHGLTTLRLLDPRGRLGGGGSGPRGAGSSAARPAVSTLPDEELGVAGRWGQGEGDQRGPGLGQAEATRRPGESLLPADVGSRWGRLLTPPLGPSHEIASFGTLTLLVPSGLGHPLSTTSSAGLWPWTGRASQCLTPSSGQTGPRWEDGRTCGQGRPSPRLRGPFLVSPATPAPQREDLSECEDPASLHAGAWPGGPRSGLQVGPPATPAQAQPRRGGGGRPPAYRLVRADGVHLGSEHHRRENEEEQPLEAQQDQEDDRGGRREGAAL